MESTEGWGWLRETSVPMPYTEHVPDTVTCNLSGIQFPIEKFRWLSVTLCMNIVQLSLGRVCLYNGGKA